MKKVSRLLKETEPQCVNCGSTEEDGNMVINSCGHQEYICDDCCRVLDNIHYNFDKDTWYCEDKCLKCYN